mgnify:CR=1 FL=1
MTKTASMNVDESPRAADLLSLDSKLGRMAWVAKLINPSDWYFFQDGSASMKIFHEILESYIDGKHHSTKLLGFVFIERSIAGRLAHIGEITCAKKSSEKLLREAVDRCWIEQNEYDALESLRKERNALTHFRSAKEEKTNPSTEEIITAVFAIIKSTSI